MTVVGRILGLLGLSVLFIASSSHAKIEIENSNEPFRVGDLVQIVITTRVPRGEEPALPQWSEAWGKAEIREIGPVELTDATDGSVEATQRLLVAFYETGEFELALPGPRDAVGTDESHDAQAAESVVVQVESVLPDGDSIPAPRPPSPPIRLPLGSAFVWTAAVLGVASLLTAALLLRRYRREAGPRAARDVDPLSALNQALHDLDGRRDIELVFTELSLHFRHFLGTVLEFPAAESTTSEIRRQLRQQDVSSTLVRRTDLLLQRCDGVKFARQAASPEDAGSSIAEARRLGAETHDLLSIEPVESREAV